MKRSIIHIILFLFLVTSLSGQKVPIEQIENKIYEATCKDIKLLSLSEDDIARSDSERIYHIISLVVLAEKHTQQKDTFSSHSLQLYNKACLLVSDMNFPEFETWVHTKFGFYFYRFGMLEKAMGCFLHVSRILDIDEGLVPVYADEVYKKNAYFFETIGDQAKSEEYYNKALKYTDIGSEGHVDIINGYAFSLINVGKLGQAQNLLHTSLKISKTNNYSLLYAKALGGMSEIFIAEDNLDQAEQYLLEDIRISQEVKDGQRNTMFAQILLGRLYLEQKNFDKAKETLRIAEKYARSKSYLNGFDYEITLLYRDIYFETGEYLEELYARHKLDSIDASGALRDSKEVANKILLQSQREKFIWKLKAEQAKHEKTRFLQYGLIIFVFLLFLLIVMVIVSYKRKIKIQSTQYESRILTFELEKIQSEKKLEEAKYSLSSYKSFLLERKKQVEKMEIELEKLKKSSNSHIGKEKDALQKLLDSHLMSYENWAIFKETFQREKPELYQKIITHLPDLSEAQLRVVMLHHLGLSNVEIANIIGITVDGVKKSKQRLRKRYEELDL